MEWQKSMYKVYFQFVAEPEVEPTTYKRNDMAVEYPDDNVILFAERYFQTEEEAIQFTNTSRHKNFTIYPLND